jgi:ribonuclease Z
MLASHRCRVLIALCVVSFFTWAHAAEHPRPAFFRITLLGTGNPRPSAERFGPSILVEVGERKILIDAGRGSTIRLFQLGRGALLKQTDTILLTHLHSDHTVGLSDMWLTGWIFGRESPLHVYGPPGTGAMMDNLKRAYEVDVHTRRDVDEHFSQTGVEIEAHDTGPGIIFDACGLKITAFAVDHRPLTPAYGYRIDYRGHSAVFSGDTRTSDNLIEHARGVDVLVHEVISPALERKRAQVDPEKAAKVIAHHTTPEDAGRVFAQIKPRLAVYSHIVPSLATARDLVPDTRKNYKGPLLVGHDLMTITIGDKILVTTRKPIPDQ